MQTGPPQTHWAKGHLSSLSAKQTITGYWPCETGHWSYDARRHPTRKFQYPPCVTAMSVGASWMHGSHELPISDSLTKRPFGYENFLLRKDCRHNLWTGNAVSASKRWGMPEREEHRWWHSAAVRLLFSYHFFFRCFLFPLLMQQSFMSLIFYQGGFNSGILLANFVKYHTTNLVFWVKYLLLF